MANKEKIVLSGLLFFGFAAFYFSFYSINYTIFDFERILKLPDEYPLKFDLVAKGFYVMTYASYLTGFIAIIILDLCNRQLLLSLVGFLLSIVTAIFPLNTNYTLYLFLSGLRGVAQPFQQVIPSIWIIDLFRGGNYVIAYQILGILQLVCSFTFAFIVRPYRFFNSTSSIASDIFESFSYQKSALNISSLGDLEGDVKKDLKAGLDLEDLFSGHKTSQLWKPYAFLAAAILVPSFLQLIGYFVKPYKKPAPVDDPKRDPLGLDWESLKKNMPNWYSILFTAMICLSLCFFRFFEHLSFDQFTGYILKKSKLFEHVDSLNPCIAIFFYSILAGKVLNLFSRISLQSTLFINFFATIIGITSLMLMINFHVYAVYVSLLLLGLGMSNIESMAICLIEERITLTNKKISIIFFLLSLIEYIYVYFSQSFRKQFDSSKFVDNSLTILSVSLLIYFAIGTIDTLRVVNQSLGGLPKIDSTVETETTLEIEEIEEKSEDKIKMVAITEKIETVETEIIDSKA